MGQEGLKFYRCNTCGNLFLVMIDPSVTPSCCGSEMQLLDSSHHTHEGSEKHLPIIDVHEDYTEVRVGLQLHPMSALLRHTRGKYHEIARISPFLSIHAQLRSDAAPCAI